MPITNILNYIIGYLNLSNIKGSKRLANIISKRILKRPKGIINLKTIYGFKLEINPLKDSGIEKSLYYNGYYEAGTIHVLSRLLKEGDIFVDIGANIGLISLFAAKKVKEKGKIISFEANPVTFQILSRNIEQNKFKNIEFFNYALGSEEGEGFIYDNWEVGRGAASLIKPNFSTTQHKIIIKRLDNFKYITESNIKIIKIDVEGWEMEVLSGAISIISGEFAPILIIEYSEEINNNTTKQLPDFIKKVNNYEIYKLEKTKSMKSKLVKINSDSDLPKEDNLFCFKEEHLAKLPTELFVKR